MSQTIAMKDGSFFVRPNGQLLLISETDKGEQDLVEAFTTPYLDDEAYGNELYRYVGQPPVLGAIMETQVGMFVDRCFERFHTLQQQDSYLTDNESLAEMVNLQVQSLGQSDSYLYSFSAHTASGNIVGNREFQVSARQAEPPQLRQQPVGSNPWPFLWLQE